MNSIEDILGKEELDKVLADNSLTLVDFYASWCAPCKMQTPLLIEFNQEMAGKVKIIKIDVDQNPELANKYSVESIPTIILFQNGKEKEKTVGLTTKATLSEMLIKYL
ncbi:MAG: thioredoxin [Clostridiales bacterium]|nr:thioredoxin [Clostridiales bacterium]